MNPVQVKVKKQKDPREYKLAEITLIRQVAEAVRDALAANGMAQYELATALGVSPAHISQLLSDSNMTLRTLADIAHALDLTVKLTLE